MCYNIPLIMSLLNIQNLIYSHVTVLAEGKCNYKKGHKKDYTYPVLVLFRKITSIQLKNGS